jgi:thiosulfate/3-mercaptopyruvate sulfurtransferase
MTLLSMPRMVALLLLSLVAAAPLAFAQSGSALKLAPAVQIEPIDLNKLLHGSSTDKPLVLQVGSKVLYAESHIPGAEFFGPSAPPDALANRVAKLPHSTAIVLYCGCCPWERCPNIAPAFQKLQALGFTNVKVLHIPQNFGQDWAQKGYPVEPAH